MTDDPTRIHEPPSGQATAYKASGDPEALVGQMLKGAYRIEGKIGEGGMGIVFRATQINLGRPVAVKVIHVGSRIPASGVDRFFLEARLLSQLSHPNVVQIIDFGTEPGPLHFMVMEFLSGESLDRFVEARPRLSPELVLDLMEQICAGMTAAHGANVIHRDLKPSNLFISNVTGSLRPLVKILDFGLGKELTVDESKKQAGITREGVMMGTCGYSAPEQLHGGNVDELADIYSLGAILYYLIAGRPPYRDEGFRTTLVKQLTNVPDPIDPDTHWPELPAVEAVIHKAMSVRTADRYPTPTDLFADLTAARCPDETTTGGYKSATRRAPITHTRPSSRIVQGRVVTETPRRRPWILLVAALGLAALIGGVLWYKMTPTPAGRRKSASVAAGVSDDRIVFGISAPFSGPTKELGRGIKVGIDARFAAENEQGGVHGRKLQLIEYDDGYEPRRTEENMRKLIEKDEVFCFIGNVGSPTARAALPVALKHERLFFAPYTGARFLRGEPPNRYVFNYRAAYDDETSAIVRYLISQRGVKPEEIAVFAQNDDYGDDGFEGVARALRTKHNRKRSDILRVNYERNTTNVTAAVEKIHKEAKSVKAVVMVATYPAAAEFIQQVRDKHVDVICTNISFVGSDSLAEKLRGMGPRYVNGVIVTQAVPPLDANSTGVVRFRKDLAKFSRTEVPSFVALEGYVAASVLIDALKRTGEELTTERLIDELEKTRDLELGIGAPISFGPSRHQGTTKVWAIELDEKGGYRELDLD